MTLRLLRGARHDFVEASDYLREHGGAERSKRFEDAIVEVLEQIESNPSIAGRKYATLPARTLTGERIRVAYRRVTVTRFKSKGKYPYSVIYFLDGDVPVVVAIWQGARHPSYWRKRPVDEPPPENDA